MKETTEKKTLNAVAIVMAITILMKLIGFVREALIGSTFGATMEADSFIMAQKITVTIFMSIGSAINVALIPIIAEKMANNENVIVKRFVNKIFTISLMLTLYLTAMFTYFAKPFTSFIAGGFDGEKLEIATRYVQVLFPASIFIFAAYIFRAVLQSKKRFAAYSMMSLPYNFLIIIYLVFFASSYGIYGLAVATVLGWFLQMMLPVPFLIKDKMKVRLDFDFKDKNIRKFAVLLMPILISSFIYSVNTLFDSSFASRLSDGRVAALEYGFRVYFAISTTIIFSISTVLFPKLIDVHVLNDKEEFSVHVSNIIRNIIFIIIPILLGLVLVSRDLIEMAYLRGNFTLEAVELTQTAFVFYSLGILGFAMQEILNKTFFAVKNTIVPTICSVISVIVNILLNFWLIDILGMKGLALATSLSLIFNAVLLYIAIQIVEMKLNNIKIIIDILKQALAGIIMYFGVRYIKINLDNYIDISSGILYNLINIAYMGISGVVIYGVTTYILRVEQTTQVVEAVLKKIKKA